MSTVLSRVCLATALLICTGCQVAVPTWPLPVLEVVAGNATAPPSPVHVLLQDGKLPEAERLLRNAIERAPTSIADRTNLGILLARTGRMDAATDELNVVLEERPDYCPALLQRAQLQLARYDIAGAEQSYRTCLTASPEYEPALLNLGILFELYRGDFDQALHHYERYQQQSSEPDRRVANWITDLSRRLAVQPSMNRINQFAEVTP